MDVVYGVECSICNDILYLVKPDHSMIDFRTTKVPLRKIHF